MESRGDDLQTLARAIMNRTGRSLLFNPNHSTTQRLTHLAEIPLQQERRQFGITAENVINILCKTDPPDMNTMDRVRAAPPTDYLGYPIGQPGHNGVDNWGNLNRSETGWGNWFGIIAQVSKAWNAAAQKRRRNPSHITIHDWHGVVEDWEPYGGRILREIKTSYKTYTKLHSIYVSYRAIQSKTQAHKLIKLLRDLVPTLKKLHMPNTTTEIGLRAAKTLAMRGLGLRDSIQLVTWLHGLPITGAKDFLVLIKDSPRATVTNMLEGCEQIAQPSHTGVPCRKTTPRTQRGHPIREHLLPFVLIFERELFPRLTYMKNLITHIHEWARKTYRGTQKTSLPMTHCSTAKMGTASIGPYPAKRRIIPTSDPR